MSPSPTPVVRAVLITVGFVFVTIGAIGVFVPVLPTTPFLLLAAACFARGSQRFYAWLINHRIFGGFIRNYREKGGITRRQKTVALGTFWPGILIGAWLAPSWLWIRIFLAASAIGVTTYLIRLKTVDE